MKTLMNIKTGIAVNPFEGVKMFYISPYSLELYKSLKITPEVIAAQGMLGLERGLPVVYIPLDYIFENVIDCSCYHSSENHWNLAFSRVHNVITSIYCSVEGDKMRFNTILYKKLHWPSHMTPEEGQLRKY